MKRNPPRRSWHTVGRDRWPGFYPLCPVPTAGMTGTGSRSVSTWACISLAPLVFGSDWSPWRPEPVPRTRTLLVLLAPCSLPLVNSFHFRAQLECLLFQEASQAGPWLWGLLLLLRLPPPCQPLVPDAIMGSPYLLGVQQPRVNPPRANCVAVGGSEGMLTFM